MRDLLPCVHRLLVVLDAFLEHDVEDGNVLDMAVALKLGADLGAKNRWRYVESVKLADFGSLTGVKPAEAKGVSVSKKDKEQAEQTCASNDTDWLRRHDCSGGHHIQSGNSPCREQWTSFEPRPVCVTRRRPLPVARGWSSC